MIDNIIHAAIVMTTPLLLAALGGLINRVGGIVNIGLDSMMLAGALVGPIVASASGTWIAALVGAAAVGALLGLLMSLAVTRLEANEIIVGPRASTSPSRGWCVSSSSPPTARRARSTCPTWRRLPRNRHPGVADVPVLGAILSGHDPLTWAAWIMVPLTAWFLRRMRAGASPARGGRRAAGGTGARTEAAESARCLDRLCRCDVGPRRRLPVDRRRRHLQRRHHRRRGFIALAAFYFGRNHPWATALGALLFGFFDAFQIRMQGRGVPAELVADAALCRWSSSCSPSLAIGTPPFARREDIPDDQSPTRRRSSSSTSSTPSSNPAIRTTMPASRRSSNRCVRLRRRRTRLGAIVVHAAERHRRGLRRFRMAQAADPPSRRRTRRSILRAISRPRAPTRRWSTSAASVPSSPPTSRSSCTSRTSRALCIAGVKTNVCIRATAQDAFASGFEPVVPREATNSNRPHLAEASLEDIDRYMGACRVPSLRRWRCCRDVEGRDPRLCEPRPRRDARFRADAGAHLDDPRPPERGWPRLGGSPAFVAAALVQAGLAGRLAR